MKCLACQNILTDVEQKRKYSNHEDIKDPEARYIGLCNKCFRTAFHEDELELDDNTMIMDKEGDCY